MNPYMRLATIALATLLLGVGGNAVAGGFGDAREVAVHIFEMADRDESGALTPDEFEAADLAAYGVDFEAYDADADGETSRDEYLQMFDAHHGAEGIDI